MGVPVEASSAPEMRLVNILGIVGRTGHSYEVGWTIITPGRVEGI